MSPSAPTRRWPGRSLAVLFGLAPALLLAETGLRLWTPGLVRLAGEERNYTRALVAGEARRVLTPDAKLGYRPVLDGDEYAAHGARHNRYALAKPDGVRRLLFLGDSVTHRGALIEALRKRWGERDLEYWNAGVEGYSTPQELGWYEGYLAGIDEDHLVLTFHLNDFETTPLTFIDGEGRVRIYFSRLPLADLNPWLLRRSYLYRLLVGYRIENVAPHGFEEEIVSEVRSALDGLRAVCEERGSRLTVLLLPWLAPASEWTPQIRSRHERALTLLRELEIAHHDLLPALEEALAEGVDVQAQPGDRDHPSTAFAEHAAGFLEREGFVP